jgi:hypothetical protein
MKGKKSSCGVSVYSGSGGRLVSMRADVLAAMAGAAAESLTMAVAFRWTLLLVVEYDGTV